MLLFLLWAIVLIISIILFSKSAGSISLFKPNLISISFYYSFLITCFIGGLLIVLDIDNFYMMYKLNHEEIRVTGFLLLCYIMIFFPLTMFIVNTVSGFNAKSEFNNYLSKPVENLFKVKTEFYYIFLTLSLICIMTVVYTLMKTEHVPIFELLKGTSSEELARYRIESSRGFEGNVLIRNIFGIALTPLMSLIAYIYAVKTKLLKWRILFLCLLISAIIISVYDLAKSPILFYIAMLILVRIYIGKTKLSFSKLLIIGFLASIAVITMYIITFDIGDISKYLSYSSGPIGRIILSQSAPFFLHLDYFGNELPFLNGKSLPSLILGLYDIEQVRSARLVMETAFPESIENGTGGVLNTIFAAEAFANFGYLGVIFGTIYIALIIQILYIILIKLPKTPVFLSILVYFTINIPRTLVGGFTDFILNPIWIFIVMLFVGIYLFIRLRIDLLQYLKMVRKN